MAPFSSSRILLHSPSFMSFSMGSDAVVVTVPAALLPSAGCTREVLTSYRMYSVLLPPATGTGSFVE